MISIIYRTEVEVPEEVFRHLGHTSTYDRAVLAATEGAASKGQNAYSEVVEWAEDSDRALIENIDQKLRDMVQRLQQQLKG